MYVTLKNKSLSSDRVTSLYQFPPAAKCIHSLQKPIPHPQIEKTHHNPPIGKSNSPPSDCKQTHHNPRLQKPITTLRLENPPSSSEPPQLTSVTFQTVVFS